MNPEITNYNHIQATEYQKICQNLAIIIMNNLPDANSKVWHSHPVWFINDNPIVGYSVQKKGVRLMFWSGASFEEEKLNILGLKFKDASIFYNFEEEIDVELLKKWLQKSIVMQWDYKNIVKRKGKLEKLEL